MKSTKEIIDSLKETVEVYENPNSDFYDLRQIIDISQAFEIIRSHDKELIAKCKEFIKREEGLYMGDGKLFSRQYIETILDCVLKDLY
jgi:hypothetical protein